MKLLLDESVPRQLLKFFPDTYVVRTVAQMGWAGTKNGKLLFLAQENGFLALVTADRNIEYQQNAATLGIPVFILIAYRTHVSGLSPLIPKLHVMLQANLKPGIYRVTE